MGKCLFMRKGEIHKNPGLHLPSGYTELAYIQSSGTQWIDTGVLGKSTLGIDARIQATVSSGNKWYFGGRDSGTVNRFDFVYVSTTSEVRFYYGANKMALSGLSADADMQISIRGNVCTANGVTVTLESASFTGVNNIYICTCSGGTAANETISQKIYYFKIYDGETLIRDFVPCIKDDGTVGLYDLVGKQFYGNAGTGAFVGSEVV